MGLGWKVFVIAVVAIAVLCQFEVKKNMWLSSKTILLKGSLEDTFNFVTSSDYIDKWFPFVSRVREADGRPLGLDKKYYAVYDIPFSGEYLMVYRIVDYKKERLIVIEGENLLLPRIEFQFTKVKEDESKMTITIAYRRLSYCFQYSIGPLLYFLTSQKLQHSLFLLRMIFPY